jgi:hypothetical protein
VLGCSGERFLNGFHGNLPPIREESVITNSAGNLAACVLACLLRQIPVELRDAARERLECVMGMGRRLHLTVDDLVIVLHGTPQNRSRFRRIENGGNERVRIAFAKDEDVPRSVERIIARTTIVR